MAFLFQYFLMNRAGTRYGRATWLYLALWAIFFVAAYAGVFSEHVSMWVAFLSPLILLLNRLDTSGLTKEEAEQAARELTAAKEAEYQAKFHTTWAYRLGKWVRRHKSLVKIVDVLSTQIAGLSLASWVSLLVIVAVIAAIFYQRTQYTNQMYLTELVRNHKIEEAADGFVAGVRKAESAMDSQNDWEVIEQGLSNCMAREANLYLESDDPYLHERANKNTPKVLVSRFLKSCGAIE